MEPVSAGVLTGAKMPFHWLASKPGTNSPTVGISGRVAVRAAVPTANARSFPAL
jgi:hypothetical protein